MRACSDGKNGYRTVISPAWTTASVFTVIDGKDTMPVCGGKRIFPRQSRNDFVHAPSTTASIEPTANADAGLQGLPAVMALLGGRLKKVDFLQAVGVLLLSGILWRVKWMPMILIAIWITWRRRWRMRTG
jgi:hypothetical protein